MPPQSSDIIEVGYNHNDCSSKDDFAMFLSKHNVLNSSIDTSSTSSTEIESSWSKDSLSSDEENELGSPNGLLQRDANCQGNRDGWAQRVWKGEPRQVNSFDCIKNRRPLLLSALLLFFSFALVASNVVSERQSTRWDGFLQKEAKELQKEIYETPTGQTFTIRLRGKRLDLLQQSLDAHSRCSSVEEIQVDYEGDQRLPDTVFQHGTGKAVSLEAASTNGIFLLVEGINFTCEELDKAFNTWKKDPRRLVGFFGYYQDSTSSSSSSSSNSRDDISLVRSDGPYSIISDRASFVHSRYLDALASFWSQSCCDTLLSMQVSLASARSPVLMKARPRELIEYRSTSSFEGGCADGPSPCSALCTPSWMRLNDLRSLPGSTAAVLG